MEDLSNIILDQADRIFSQHVTKSVLVSADTGGWPASLWSALADAGLPSVAPGIHQFGWIGMPKTIASTLPAGDQSSISGIWSFQTLMGLKEQLRPTKVNHWDSIGLASAEPCSATRSGWS